jgi:hypothetical protein
MVKARKMRVHVYPEPCDMRLGFAGLHGLVREHFGSAASTGHRYLFINRARDYGSRFKTSYDPKP